MHIFKFLRVIHTTTINECHDDSVIVLSNQFTENLLLLYWHFKWADSAYSKNFVMLEYLGCTKLHPRIFRENCTGDNILIE